MDWYIIKDKVTLDRLLDQAGEDTHCQAKVPGCPARKTPRPRSPWTVTSWSLLSPSPTMIIIRDIFLICWSLTWAWEGRRWLDQECLLVGGGGPDVGVSMLSQHHFKPTWSLEYTASREASASLLSESVNKTPCPAVLEPVKGLVCCCCGGFRTPSGRIAWDLGNEALLNILEPFYIFFYMKVNMSL